MKAIILIMMAYASVASAQSDEEKDQWLRKEVPRWLNANRSHANMRIYFEGKECDRDKIDFGRESFRMKRISGCPNFVEVSIEYANIKHIRVSDWGLWTNKKILTIIFGNDQEDYAGSVDITVDQKWADPYVNSLGDVVRLSGGMLKVSEPSDEDW